MKIIKPVTRNQDLHISFIDLNILGTSLYLAPDLRSIKQAS